MTNEERYLWLRRHFLELVVTFGARGTIEAIDLYERPYETNGESLDAAIDEAAAVYDEND